MASYEVRFALQDSPEELEKLRVAKKERMRSLGNMQFIGHLFKEEMLTEKIIHQCIVDLLREQVCTEAVAYLHKYSVLGVFQS